MGRDTFDRVLSSVPLNSTAGKVTSRGDHYDPAIKQEVRRYSDIPTHSDLPSRCIPVPKITPDLTGKKTGRITVVGYLGRLNPKNQKKASWLVKCLCGNYETRVGAAIKNPNNVNDCCLKCRHWRNVKRRYDRLGGQSIEEAAAQFRSEESAS